VAAALVGADCFFGSLLFDFDTVEWLREKLSGVPLLLVFESALELMGMTRIGTFAMDPSGEEDGAIGISENQLLPQMQLVGPKLGACFAMLSMA